MIGNVLATQGKSMSRKAKKQSTERPTVGVRLPPALRESLMAEAKRKRIRLAEEIRYRLAKYDQMERTWNGRFPRTGEHNWAR